MDSRLEAHFPLPSAALCPSPTGLSAPQRNRFQQDRDEWAVHLNRDLAVQSRRQAACWLSLGASLEVSIYPAVHNLHVCQKPKMSWDRGTRL